MDSLENLPVQGRQTAVLYCRPHSSNDSAEARNRFPEGSSGGPALHRGDPDECDCTHWTSASASSDRSFLSVPFIQHPSDTPSPGCQLAVDKERDVDSLSPKAQKLSTSGAWNGFVLATRTDSSPSSFFQDYRPQHIPNSAISRQSCCSKLVETLHLLFFQS